MRRLVLPIACLVCAFPAGAAADTLAITPSPTRAAQGALVRVAYAGTVDGAASLYATVFSYLHPGRGACARTQEREGNRVASAQLHMLVLRSAGAFTLRRPLPLVDPGLYRLCGYLQHRADAAHVPDALATALVRVVRRPR